MRGWGGAGLFSESINVWLQQFSVPWLDSAFLFVSHLGSEYAYILLVTFVYWCINRRAGRTLVLAFIATAWLNGVLKDSLGWPRPSGDMLRVLAYEWSSGFPSGHAQLAATAWGYIALRWRNRVTLAVLVASLFLISLSRLYLGLHTLDQVLAGIIIGLGVAYGAYVLEQRRSLPPRPSVVRTALTAVLSYLAAIPVQSDDGFRLAGVLMGFLLTDAVYRRGGDGTAATAPLLEAAVPVRTAVCRALIGWLGFGLGYIAIKKLVAPGVPVMLAYAALAVWVTSGAPYLFNRLKLGHWQCRPKQEADAAYHIPVELPAPAPQYPVPATLPRFTAALFALLAVGITLAGVEVSSRLGAVSAVTGSQAAVQQLPALAVEDPFLVIGHRGAAGLAPGNTQLAFTQGLEAGADVLECDVRRTLDGHLVVFHDEYVDDTTDGTGQVAALTLAELRRLDAGYRFAGIEGSYPHRGQVQVTTLENVLRAFPTARFIIEMKDYSVDMPHALLAVLDATNARERAIVASFDGPTIRRFRQLAPDVPTALARDEVLPFVVMMRLGVGMFYKPPARYLQIPERQGVVQLVTPATVRLAHRLGMDVHVWTVNDRIAMQRLVASGVDGIVTDYPNYLMDVVTGRTKEMQ